MTVKLLYEKPVPAEEEYVAIAMFTLFAKRQSYTVKSVSLSMLGSNAKIENVAIYCGQEMRRVTALRPDIGPGKNVFYLPGSPCIIEEDNMMKFVVLARVEEPNGLRVVVEPVVVPNNDSARATGVEYENQTIPFGQYASM